MRGTQQNREATGSGSEDGRGLKVLRSRATECGKEAKKDVQVGWMGEEKCLV